MLRTALVDGVAKVRGYQSLKIIICKGSKINIIYMKISFGLPENEAGMYSQIYLEMTRVVVFQILA